MNETMKNGTETVTGAIAAGEDTGMNGHAGEEARTGESAPAMPKEPTEEELAPWEEMLAAYPEADAPEKLPEGVMAAIAGGKAPLIAMHEAEIARLKGVIAGYEQKEKAALSCGSVAGTAAPACDPVLEILLGE